MAPGPKPAPPADASAALKEYLARVDPAYHDLMRAVHEAVMTAGEPFDVAIKWQMLMYTRGGDWRNWVVGISQMGKAVNVRFFGGTLLDDPGRRLRYGKSHLGSLDVPTLAAFEPEVLAGYLSQAIANIPYVRANEGNLPRR